ncbi:unnamed protein product [Effrenium voratum]|nr:unnamed protein product [Effrenium voratum]CAJ1439324.1 unnamed protein product [Effrenium voratum]CAJ1439325.1 unnamed protein product [Effrenium voratum]
MAAELQQSHLRAALAENMRQIRSCEQQAKRRAASLEAGGLTSLSVKKVLAVYTLSEWQKEAALQAAQQLTTLKAEHPQYPTSALVDRMFLQADLNDLLCMFDDTNVQWEQAVRFARQMLAERGVFSWVKKQNLAHGTAPLSADVFDRLKREMRDNALPAPAPATSRGIRKAVARWRARWSVRRAKLRETDQVDPELLRQKVHMFWRTVSYVTAKCHALEQGRIGECARTGEGARKRSRLLKKAGGLSSSDLVWLLSRKSAAD